VVFFCTEFRGPNAVSIIPDEKKPPQGWFLNTVLPGSFIAK
jgi:hypothetical protein